MEKEEYIIVKKETIRSLVKTIVALKQQLSQLNILENVSRKSDKVFRKE